MTSQGPPVKAGELAPPKTTPQGPPAKAGEHIPPVVVKEAATPKAKSEAVPQTDQPKTEGQPKPPVTLASQTRKLEFAPPSKPQRPPPQPQVEVAYTRG